MLVLFARRLCLFTKGAAAFQHLLAQRHGKLAPLLLELAFDGINLSTNPLRHRLPVCFGARFAERLEVRLDALLDPLPPRLVRSRFCQCSARGKFTLHGRAGVIISDAGIIALLINKDTSAVGLAASAADGTVAGLGNSSSSC